MSQVYVEPFLGAGAVWLRLLGEDLVPPVSWMGGKRRLAWQILELLGLKAGRPVPAVLGDASWWGWVWPVLLDEVQGPAVSEILRSWRGEDPRELWFRLRDEGPAQDVRERAAGLLWLQARAASGVPVWWEEEMAVKWDRTRTSHVGPANQTHASELVQDGGYKSGGRCTRSLFPATSKGFGRLLQHASTQIDEAGQRQAPEPRLLGCDGRGVPREAGTRTTRQERLLAYGGGCGNYEAGSKGLTGAGGIVDPGTVARRLDSMRTRLVMASGNEPGIGYDDGVRRGRGWRLFSPEDVAARLDAIPREPVVTILHADALDLTKEWSPRLGDSARVYLDPPYQGATGYPAACSRERVLAVADTWAKGGARVVLSEAVPLDPDLGSGWVSTCLRPGRKPEWVTCYGCDMKAIVPPLLARMGAA